MRCERRTLGDAREAGMLAAELRALIPSPRSIREAATEIVEAVRRGGDRALTDLARRHDDLPLEMALTVARADIEEAGAALDARARDGLALALANVETVARAGVHDGVDIELGQGQRLRMRELPVHSACIYVPGGRCAYPSTVVMGAVTARVAGVERVVVCSPRAHPAVLAACAMCGVSEVHRIGGAHAVAAMAYGTETIRAVDVIAGPGNLWVQEAKRIVSSEVGIDGYLGPSDVFVLATGGADAGLVALDLLAQAEHGEGTMVIGASDEPQLLGEVEAVLTSADLDTAAVGALVQVPDAAAGLALAEAFAPEHLELQGAAAEELSGAVSRAGCVFVGSESATAFGDYVAGSNHSLPTGGSARFGSALSPRHFRRRMAEVRIGSAARALAAPGAAVAREEGFEIHARSMEARVRENCPP